MSPASNSTPATDSAQSRSARNSAKTPASSPQRLRSPQLLLGEAPDPKEQCDWRSVGRLRRLVVRGRRCVVTGGEPRKRQPGPRWSNPQLGISELEPELRLSERPGGGDMECAQPSAPYLLLSKRHGGFPRLCLSRTCSDATPRALRRRWATRCCGSPLSDGLRHAAEAQPENRRLSLERSRCKFRRIVPATGGPTSSPPCNREYRSAFASDSASFDLDT